MEYILKYIPQYKINLEEEEIFLNSLETKAERTLRLWEQKLEERDEFLFSMKYSKENHEILDKLLSESDKLWKRYQTCLKDIEKELESSRGGIVESLSETNDI